MRVLLPVTCQAGRRQRNCQGKEDWICRVDRRRPEGLPNRWWEILDCPAGAPSPLHPTGLHHPGIDRYRGYFADRSEWLLVLPQSAGTVSRWPNPPIRRPSLTVHRFPVKPGYGQPISDPYGGFECFLRNPPAYSQSHPGDSCLSGLAESESQKRSHCQCLVPCPACRRL